MYAFPFYNSLFKESKPGVQSSCRLRGVFEPGEEKGNQDLKGVDQDEELEGFAVALEDEPLPPGILDGPALKRHHVATPLCNCT